MFLCCHGGGKMYTYSNSDYKQAYCCFQVFFLYWWAYKLTKETKSTWRRVTYVLPPYCIPMPILPKTCRTPLCQCSCRTLRRLGGQQIDRQIYLNIQDRIRLPINSYKRKRKSRNVDFLNMGFFFSIFLYRALLLKEVNSLKMKTQPSYQ